MRLDKWARSSANKVKNVHFVGVGGSGMSGLAEILAGLGYKVSGSDAEASSTLDRLSAAGVDCHVGHKKDYLADVDLVVRSSAIYDDNIEIKSAIKMGVPVIQRAEMLAELMRFGVGIAVAGSHGKTTTTSMMARLLRSSGEDTTFIVGGLVKTYDTNAKLGKGKYIVAEADESDASFLFLDPVIAIVTNIDDEHITGSDGLDQLKQNFVQFFHNIPFDGLVVVCIDSPNVRAIINEINRPIIKYGMSKDADYRAKKIKQKANITTFTAIFPDKEEVEMKIAVPGEHNVMNALACIATARFLGISKKDIAKGLADFMGVARRQDILGVFDGETNDSKTIKDVMLIDDYGHHPNEIAATIKALSAGWKNRRKFMIFQPHRYSRTKYLFDQFVEVLGNRDNLDSLDSLIILDIYPAGEKPIRGISSKKLVEAIAKKARKSAPKSIKASDPAPIYVKDHDKLVEVLHSQLQSGDLLITQGAGNLGMIAKNLALNGLYLRAETKHSKK